MKMAELMNVSPALPGVLTRLGIPFGFGDETVEEVCRRQDIDPETFLLVCSVHANGVLPPKERTRKAELKDVLKYFNVGEITIDEYEGDEGELILDITGDDLAVHIGRHVKTLEALQFIISAITVR